MYIHICLPKRDEQTNCLWFIINVCCSMLKCVAVCRSVSQCWDGIIALSHSRAHAWAQSTTHTHTWAPCARNFARMSYHCDTRLQWLQHPGAMCCRVLTCIAMCCCVLPCVAVCCVVLECALARRRCRRYGTPQGCSELQCVAMSCNAFSAPSRDEDVGDILHLSVAVCRSLLQGAAVCCRSVMPWRDSVFGNRVHPSVAVCCSVLSVLLYVAVCCSVLQCKTVCPVGTVYRRYEFQWSSYSSRVRRES